MPATRSHWKPWRHEPGGVDSRVVTVLDLKTPASGEVERNDYSNIPC